MLTVHCQQMSYNYVNTKERIRVVQTVASNSSKLNCWNIQSLHTYIIGHYNPLVRIILTPRMLCVLILYISGGTCSLKSSTPNDRFFEKLFMAVLIYSQSFCRKYTERKQPKKYFLSYFVLMPGLGFTLNKPTHYLLDYGNSTSRQYTLVIRLLAIVNKFSHSVMMIL